VYGKRHGEFTFSFDIDEQDISDGMRAAIYCLDKEARKVIAAIRFGRTQHLIGEVTFGGFNLKRSGDSVLKLDTSMEALRLQVQGLQELCEEYVILKIVVV
jgi:hypothetical protein